ncbi:MAG: class I SAM-dependent methyltransferase, partial [Candidatus Limnocylindria bacterium]
MVGESTDDRYKETERVRRLWDRAAPKYDRMIAFWEKVLFSGGRRWVCSRAAGDVLEIAIGTGRNFEHYPEAVRLTGIDLSEAMLAIARQRAREVGR